MVHDFFKDNQFFNIVEMRIFDLCTVYLFINQMLFKYFKKSELITELIGQIFTEK